MECKGAGGTYGLWSCVGEGVWVGIYRLALDLIRPAAIVPQAASDGAHITLGHGKSLSIIKRLNSTQEVYVLLNQVGEVDQELASIFRGHLAPRALECLASRGDGNVDILLGGLVDGGDDLFGGRVDDLEGLAIDAFDELVVDEPGRSESV